jgi:hypothetical protein
VIQLSLQLVGIGGHIAAKSGQAGGGSGGWTPWLLLLGAVIVAGALYNRMDHYRELVHAREPLPDLDADALQRRLDHLPDRDHNYLVLCYRLARGPQLGRRALSDELDQLHAETNVPPEHPGSSEEDPRPL